MDLFSYEVSESVSVVQLEKKLVTVSAHGQLKNKEEYTRKTKQ